MFRKQLAEILTAYPVSVAQLASELDLTPRELEDDIRHLRKSLRRDHKHIVVTPARCRKCGFMFREDKLRKPGKCPRCRGTWISDPLVHIE